MAVAAARTWREATTDRAEVEVPEDVTARLSAIWADAYRAAVAAVTPERDRLAGEVEALRTEVEALATTVTEVEAERDEARTEQQTTEEQLGEASQTISSREASITELREQNRTLTSQLDALIAGIPTEGHKTED